MDPLCYMGPWPDENGDLIWPDFSFLTKAVLAVCIFLARWGVALTPAVIAVLLWRWHYLDGRGFTIGTVMAVACASGWLTTWRWIAHKREDHLVRQFAQQLGDLPLAFMLFPWEKPKDE